MTSASQLACQDALRRLDDYLDRVLSSGELLQVERHLEECLHCAEVFHFEGTLLRGLKARLRRLSIPPNLLRGIKRRLQAELGIETEPFREV